jgi:heme-degrading monooxygenase HmoA
MIVRIWRGEATRDKADAYDRHLTHSVFPTLMALPGHIGAYLLRRNVGERVEFLAITIWESLDAIKLFAGENPDVAVVEPAARAVLAEFDSFVRHYDVAYGSDCG